MKPYRCVGIVRGMCLIAPLRFRPSMYPLEGHVMNSHHGTFEGARVRVQHMWSPVKAQTTHQPACHQRHGYESGGTRRRVLLAFGGMMALLGVRTHCQSVGARKEERGPGEGVSPPLPPITLYQYQTCPFCCKTRAFLDYHGIGYKVVEVNPLFKREMKRLKETTVPFIAADGVQVRSQGRRSTVVVINLLHKHHQLHTYWVKYIQCQLQWALECSGT